jgi:hypothetical protein
MYINVHHETFGKGASDGPDVRRLYMQQRQQHTRGMKVGRDCSVSLRWLQRLCLAALAAMPVTHDSTTAQLSRKPIWQSS